MSTLKVGGMFAGYGGLEMGLAEVLDVEAAWFAEFDDAPSRILAHRWPDVPNLGDVTRVDWSAVEPVDVITGGSPCQDLSHAGKRAGMKAGTRSGLWASMCDAIDIIRPRLVVWENVRGALSAEADSGMEPCPGCVGGGDDGPVLRALGRVLGDLADIGYDAAWCGLRAADVGAPHGRFRVFVLAWPAADPASDGRHEGWAQPARIVGRPDAAQRGTTSPADPAGLNGARSVRSGTSSRRPEPPARDEGPAAADPGRLLGAAGRTAGPGEAEVRGSLGHAAGCGVSDGERVREQFDPMVGRLTLLPTPTAMDCKASGGAVGSSDVTLTDATVRADLRGISWGDYARAVARWEGVLDRPAPAPTEPTGKGGAHRLSPDFVEWMMGLPAGWTDVPGVSRNDRLRALGNGIVPPQCAAAVRHLLDVRAGAMEVAA